MYSTIFRDKARCTDSLLWEVSLLGNVHLTTAVPFRLFLLLLLSVNINCCCFYLNFQLFNFILYTIAISQIIFKSYTRPVFILIKSYSLVMILHHMILLLISFVTDLLQKCIGLINLKDGEAKPSRL